MYKLYKQTKHKKKYLKKTNGHEQIEEENNKCIHALKKREKKWMKKRKEEIEKKTWNKSKNKLYFSVQGKNDKIKIKNILKLK